MGARAAVASPTPHAPSGSYRWGGGDKEVSSLNHVWLLSLLPHKFNERGEFRLCSWPHRACLNMLYYRWIAGARGSEGELEFSGEGRKKGLRGRGKQREKYY